MRKRLYSLLNGEDSAALWYGRIMTVLIIASLLPLCFKGSSPVLESIEYVCVLVFIVDYLARWATAELKLGKGALSFLIYPFTPMAIIDLLSILPVFNALNDALRTADGNRGHSKGVAPASRRGPPLQHSTDA